MIWDITSAIKRRVSTWRDS